ncbi:serine/arginine-rich splicing factor SR45a-like [Salvia hispanica]|uniref:serine/arginine-rich splicing factor SR45a-like n=1 Tax=Salvia hispanica TaxID=49212 RepID=UPI002009BDA6|nr:serine/arginine-rich splicing factor SR45a-like [Salvia hispanica]XP_047967336.1 serine/arginine-rich splicing factor SR45a-like [Salvia hispanica]XP_047967337.1 serine/arginine-rich splicing factor SR45a-like [Salvia hispanica]
MSYSRRTSYRFPSPYYKRNSRSVSTSLTLSRSRSRSYDSSDAENPGNNLYVKERSKEFTLLSKHIQGNRMGLDS